MATTLGRSHQSLRRAMTFAGPPPHLYFIGSAVFHYLGPAFAVLLFARIDVLGVAWLRIVSAALVFVVWRRPWRTLARVRGEERLVIISWGVVLAAMNVCFYLAIARLPLSTVAAIEFVGPIALAAASARIPRNGIALALAVIGVYLLTDVRLEGDPLGILFAGLNAVLFTAYVVLGHRAAGSAGAANVDGLALAMLIAAVVVAPVGAADALPAFRDPVALLAGLGVGISSSVIPYVFDQLAMARLARATYAFLLSLLPATATVIGIIVLAQWPTAVEIGGIALVISGVFLHREPGLIP